MHNQTKEIMDKASIIKSKIENLINGGRLKEAWDSVQAYEKAIPGDPDLYSIKSVLLIMEGRFAEAKELLAEGLEKKPDCPDLLFNLGYINEQQGEYQDAYDLYMDAKDNLAGDKKDIEEALGRISLKCGQLVRRKKVVFFVKPGLDSFLNEIIQGLSSEFMTRKIVVTNSSQIDAGMRWADICWFEWCDELAVYGSNSELVKSKKMICRLHSYEAFTEYIHKINWEAFDGVIFVAEHIRKYVLGQVGNLCKEKTRVIPNGIDLKKYEYKKRTPGFNIAYVGYLNYKKGPMLLLHTFKAIFDKDPRYKLHIAGKYQDTRYLLYYNQMVRELGLEKNIFFDGWQNDISNWLEDKHYIISTSVLEGNPLGVMEAMARGIKPVVHNFVGSKDQFRPYVWNSIDEAVDMIVSDDYNSIEYRNYIEERFSLERQLESVGILIENLLDEEKSELVEEPQLITEKESVKNIEQNQVREYYDNFLGYLKKDRERENPRHIYLKNRLTQLIKKGDRVLDLGCGIGITTEHIYSLGVSKVVGVDLSPNLINYARETVKGPEFLVGDITNIELNEKFDIITMCDVMEHVPYEKYEDLFAIIKKHLNPLGNVYISIPDSNYMNFIQKYRPDLMQVIDNSIPYERISELCNLYGLTIRFYNVYSIFTGNEYNEYLLCDKENFQSPWKSLLKKD